MSDENLIPLDKWLKDHYVVAENILEFVKGISDDLKELSDGLGIPLKIVAITK